MNTKIVKKGAGRPAAQAKTKKHAQRTPLPPKTNGEKAPKVLTDLLTLREEVAPRTAKILSEDVAERAARADSSKSIPKAKAFCERVEAAGWSADRSWGEGGEDHIVVTARRDAEVIFIEWIAGVFQPTATYSQGDRNVRVRNASAGLQYAGRTAEQAAEETKKVSANRFFQKREAPREQVEAQRQPLPFDPALALEDEILAALAGRRVTWFNRIAQTPDSAVFPVEYHKQFTHITEFEGERIVNFVDHGGTGFRSFRLSGLLSISRGKSVTVKRTEQIARRQAAGFAKAGA